MSQLKQAEGKESFETAKGGRAARQKASGSLLDHKEENGRPIRVGFVGNPNCGKTTLFNAFTGAKLKVANWPGVTVERVEGETSYKGRPIKVIDLPGIYSLTSYTIEEKVTRKCIEDGEVDVIINVVDASSLERNLYLTMQLIELKKPVILALNMMDIVEERGMEIDMHRLPETLGHIPVVPVSARKRSGLDVLMHAVVHHYEEGPQGIVVHYSQELEEKISQVEDALRKKYGEMDNMRWHAIKFLEFDEVVVKDHPLENIDQILTKNYEKQIINEKYDYIEAIIQECLVNKEEKSAMTDKVDRLMTHPVWGIPVFLGIMALVFFLTFTVGDFLKGYFESALDVISSGVLAGLTGIHAAPWMISLIVDGIIAGVGGILTFLPNIFILFLALAFLEDSGYMSRVASVWKGIPAYASRFWMHSSGGYGDQGPGKPGRQKKDDTDHAFHVMFCKASDLCPVCRAVFPGACTYSCIFPVSYRTVCGNPGSLCGSPG